MNGRPIISALVGAGASWFITWIMLSRLEHRLEGVVEGVGDELKDAVDRAKAALERHTVILVFGPNAPPAPHLGINGGQGEALTAYQDRIGNGFTFKSEGPFSEEEAGVAMDAAMKSTPAPRAVLSVDSSGLISGYGAVK